MTATRPRPLPMLSRARGAACLLLGLATAAAAVAAPAAEPKLPVPLDPAVFTGILKSYKGCRDKYAEMDARVDAAGVRDGSYYRVPGFPYFRTDRFAASYKNEVSGLDDTAGWTRRMREFDQEAREFEYRNLGMSEIEIGTWRYELLACGGGLANLELFEDANLAFLRQQAQSGSEYRNPPPALAAAQKQALAQRRAATLARFRDPLPAADAAAPATLWTVKPVEDMALIAKGYGAAQPDELGVPALIDSQWRAFAERHAPALWIETAGERDRPGMPVVRGSTFAVDPAQPRMHYQITFTRLGGRALTQLNYFIWLGGRDGNSGALDSLIWRVTLDEQAQPLVYESVNASGRDPLWFAGQPLQRRAETPAGDEAALFPQAEPVSGPVALRIAAGSHALRRVVPLATAAAAAATPARSAYELRRYEDVFTLPAADDRTRSLYDASGVIPGIRDDEQAKLVGDRVAAPGALHVLGRVPVSVGEVRHFDDADRLAEVLAVPPARLAAQR